MSNLYYTYETPDGIKFDIDSECEDECLAEILTEHEHLDYVGRWTSDGCFWDADDNFVEIEFKKEKSFACFF